MKKTILIATSNFDILSINLLEHLQQINLNSEIKLLLLEGSETDVKKSFPQLSVYKVDWSNLSLLEGHLKDIQLVYHLGMYFSLQKNQSALLYQRNLFFTRALVNACVKHRVEKLLFLSAVTRLQATDSYTQQPVTEKIDELHADLNSYAKSAYLAEIEIHRAMAVGISSIIVYPSTVLSAESVFVNNKLLKQMHNDNTTYGIAGFVAMQDVVLLIQLLMDSNKNNESFILNAETLRIDDFLERTVSITNQTSISKNNFERYWVEQQLQPFSLFNLLHHFSHQQRTIESQKLRKCFPRFQYQSIENILN